MEESCPSLKGETWFEDEHLQRILALLNEGQGEARIVGGAVRNALIGRDVTDVDIATTLVPRDVMERAEKSGIKAIATGIEHGTVTLVVAHKPFEVTTLRRDVATYGRHAEVAFGTDWDEDAHRRDLTINALYATIGGDILDPVGGVEDIRKGCVRFIGDPEQRIAEDYLRILRFFRFFAWYGSGRPDAQALKAMVRARDKLVTLSAERVWAEMKKLLQAPDPERALLWMRQTGTLSVILPETENWGISAIPALVHTERQLGWRIDPMLRLEAMLPPDAERMEGLATRLRFSRAEKLRIVDWAATLSVSPRLSDREFDRRLYNEPPQSIEDKLRLGLAAACHQGARESDPGALEDAADMTRLLDRAMNWQRPVFPVSGNDLIAAGLSPGPNLGRMQRRLEQRWIDSGFSLDREALIACMNKTVT